MQMSSKGQEWVSTWTDEEQNVLKTTFLGQSKVVMKQNHFFWLVLF